MAQPLSTQHPAVVLRSHFNAVRAALVVTLIAVIALTVAVVILATDDQQSTTVSRPAPAGQLNYGSFNPTGRPDAVASPNAGPSESNIAAAIGSSAGSPSTGGPNESAVAHAVAGQ